MKSFFAVLAVFALLWGVGSRPDTRRPTGADAGTRRPAKICTHALQLLRLPQLRRPRQRGARLVPLPMNAARFTAYIAQPAPAPDAGVFDQAAVRRPAGRRVGVHQEPARVAGSRRTSRCSPAS